MADKGTVGLVGIAIIFYIAGGWFLFYSNEKEFVILIGWTFIIIAIALSIGLILSQGKNRA